MIKGLGGSSQRKLLETFDHPKAIFTASFQDLTERGGLTETVAREVSGFRDRERVKSEIEKVRRHGVSLITYADPLYPFLLKQIHDPPPFLYSAGALQSGDVNSVAIVGSRIASDYGRRITREIVQGLVSKGITIVSGLARGIDAEAHSAAIESGGRTIAVLGCGVDIVYPPEHRELYRQIKDRGAVLSELSMGSPPLSWNFPNRNRLISGLSLGTLVVEATERSGSLITARLALEQGREVFAIPGNLGSSRSRGTNRLIQSGAKLVERSEDVLEEIRPHLVSKAAGRAGPAGRAAPCDPGEARILEILGSEGAHVDEIIARSGLGPPAVLDALLRLELSGYVEQLPGKRFLSK
jgi:DNA processing protein